MVYLFAVFAPVTGFLVASYQNWGFYQAGSIILSLLSLSLLGAVTAGLMTDFARDRKYNISMLLFAGVVAYFWGRHGVYCFDFLYWYLTAWHPVIHPTSQVFHAASLVANASVTARMFASSDKLVQKAIRDGAELPGVCFLTHSTSSTDSPFTAVVHSFIRQESSMHFDLYDFYVESTPCDAVNAFTRAQAAEKKPASSESSSASAGGRSDVMSTEEAQVPFSYNPNHDPQYLHSMSEERTRWSSASYFVVRAAAVFPPLCNGVDEKIPLANVLSPYTFSPSSNGDGEDADIERGEGNTYRYRESPSSRSVMSPSATAASVSFPSSRPLQISSFFFDGHAMGGLPPACASSLDEQVAGVEWRVQRVTAMIKPNWLRTIYNVAWNLAVNTLIDIIFERDRRSSSPTVWTSEQASIQSEVKAAVDQHGQLSLSLHEAFEANSRTTIGPLSALPLSWRTPQKFSASSSEFVSAEALQGGAGQPDMISGSTGYPSSPGSHAGSTKHARVVPDQEHDEL